MYFGESFFPGRTRRFVLLRKTMLINEIVLINSENLIPRADGFLPESPAKVYFFQNVRFRWFWTGSRTLNTFNLNFFDHIFDSCATRAAIRRRTTLARARFCQPCTACWVFLFSLVYLASLVCFVLFVCLAFLFDRVFITVFGQNQNWSKHGCRLTFAVGGVCVQQGWQHWQLDIFGLFLSVLFGNIVAVQLLLAFCYDFCYF